MGHCQYSAGDYFQLGGDDGLQSFPRRIVSLEGGSGKGEESPEISS